MKPEIFYWRGSVEVQKGLIRALETDGYAVVECRKLEEVLDRVERRRPALLIVDGSAGQTDAAQRIVELSSTEVLYPVPLVFISAGATKRAQTLKRQFEDFLPVDVPFSVEEVLRPLRGIVSALDTPDALAGLKVAGGDGEALLAPKTGEAFDLQTAARNRTYGGRVLASTAELVQFDDTRLLADLPRQEQIKNALSTLTASNRWLGLHARRVAAFGATLANCLGLDTERNQNVRTVGLFLNWGLRDSLSEVLRWDRYSDKDPAMATVVAAGFRESAQFVQAELGDERASQTIEMVANLLEGTASTENEALLEDAKCAMAIEFVDRVCWANGFWNPRGVNMVLRKFLAEHDIDHEDDILWGVARGLAESVSTLISVKSMFIPSQISEVGGTRHASRMLNGDGDKSTLHVVEIVGDTGAVTIPLPNLMPGMRLAQPIVALDGKEVLQAGIELNREMIFRLWRLAAIRPVGSSAQVSSMSRR